MLVYLLLTFLISKVRSQCAAGCLKCSSSDVCLLCETWSNQVLANGTCISKTNPNCQIQSVTGTCLLCSPNFYLDPSSLACLSIPTGSAVSNCANYNSDMSCALCLTGYYISNGICQQVTNIINSCLYYNSAQKCEKCQNQFILASDKTACTSPPINQPNCINYNYINCLSCNTGFIYNQNNYFSIIFGNNLNGPLSDSTLRGPINEYNLNYDSVKYGVCAPGNIQNCISYNNFTSCAVCTANYFLTPTGTCLPFPAQIISGCSVYTSATNCVNCSQGYFLQSSTVCAAVNQVSNCVLYASDQSTTICLLCSANYFLSSAISCTLRSRSLNITNCNQTDTGNDACFFCNPNFALTSDGFACLRQLVGCGVYLPSNVFTNSLQCASCNPLFFLNYTSQSCVVGSIQNCIQYSPVANICLRCNSTVSFLNAGTCNAFTAITNCVEYQKNSPSICKTCLPNSLPFIKINACYLVQSPILGCTGYLNANTCRSCSDGYRLASGTCNLISPSSNCLRITDSGQCIKCAQQFNLFSGMCQPPFSFITQNCATSNLNGIISPGSTICTTCNVNRYPYNYRNFFMCLEAAYAYEITGANFTNCNMIDFVSSSYVCILCIPGFYMNTVTGTCVQSCPTPRSAITLFGMLGSSGSYLPSNSFYCDTPIITNCQFQMIQTENSTSNSVTNSCIACTSTFFNVITFSDIVNVVPINATGAGLGLYPTSPVDLFPIVTSCVASSSLVNIGGVTIVANCEYYFTQGSSTGCLKCLFGFQGTLGASSTFSFITSCSKMTTCNSNVQLSGNPLWITKLLSCHICTDISQIPFIFLSSGTSFVNYGHSLATYDLTLTPGTWTTSRVTGLIMNCLSPKNSLFQVDLTKLPLNCGVGMVNVQSSTSSSTSASLLTSANRANLAALCIACQPGFSSNGIIPTDNVSSPTTIPQMIGQCNTITNCLSSNWFNYCSNCASTFVYAYTVSSGIQYNMCISFSADSNCLAANIINPLVPVCAFCKIGYSINQDGVCELFSPPNCQSNMFSIVNTIIRVDFSSALYLFPQGKGCVSCISNFVSVKMIGDIYVCVASSYLSAGNLVSNTKFIINCNQYGIQQNSQVICVLCINGFVVSSSGNSCFPNTALANCIQALSSSTCTVCGSGFILVSGNCRLPSILNCAIYGPSGSGTIQICNACSAGFYLFNNACLPGVISNCATYGSTATACFICSAGYQLVTSLDNLPYCYSLLPALSCNYYEPIRFQSGVLKCQTCASSTSYYLSNTVASNDPMSVCINFQAITNCTAYNISGRPGFSNFKCLNCSSGFKLINNQCIQRTVNVTNCLLYSLSSDLCVQCSQTYFLSTDATQCLPNPVGLNFCRVYLNQNTCSGCVANYYYNLVTNQCSPVLNLNLTPNCLFYDSFQICTTCATNYFLNSNNTCQIVLAQNCLTITNSSACATCPSLRGLQNQNGLINCVSISDVRCFNFTINYPFTCLQCIQGYFPGSNGVCQSVQTTIANCIVYNSATTCSQCASGYVLNNFVSCSLGNLFGSNYDPNCLTSQIDGGLYCMSCKSGFYFQNGVCTACATMNCYYCNPANITQCLLCQSGYYMIQNGSCLLWKSSQNSTTSSGFLFKSVLAYSLFLMFLKTY